MGAREGEGTKVTHSPWQRAERKLAVPGIGEASRGGFPAVSPFTTASYFLRSRNALFLNERVGVKPTFWIIFKSPSFSRTCQLPRLVPRPLFKPLVEGGWKGVRSHSVGTDSCGREVPRRFVRTEDGRDGAGLSHWALRVKRR